ncbi:MAG: glycoside hydrolase family 3 C-terminal domain-containing protein, partial [Promethearchaeota archaeon]
TEILFAKGCPLKEKSKEGFKEAISIAQKSDIIFLVLGISPRLEGEEGQASQSDLGGDRLDIILPGVQEDLLKEIYAIGKPIILILTGGSAISVNFAKENIPAILFVWYPGEEGGNAVADVIFGDYNPAGRLPVTFYKSIEQLPEFRNYSMEGRTYRYFKDTPLYSFGFGLSYTKFRYSNLSFSIEELDVSETLEVEAEIENIGKYDGEEVIQLYISRKDARFRVPIRELKGFKRVFLKKGQKKKISFKLMPKDFSVVNLDGERFLEPGIITISIGGCQPGYNLEKDGLLEKDVSIIGKAKHFE